MTLNSFCFGFFLYIVGQIAKVLYIIGPDIVTVWDEDYFVKDIPDYVKQNVFVFHTWKAYMFVNFDSIPKRFLNFLSIF